MPNAHIGDAEIYYEEAGSGPPLLLVPGAVTPQISDRCCIAGGGPAGTSSGCSTNS